MCIVKLPGQLYKARPVVEVGDGCSFIMRNTGGFRIENEIHVGKMKRGCVSVKIRPKRRIQREFYSHYEKNLSILEGIYKGH